MATLRSLLDVPGVLAAWRWQPGSTSSPLRAPHLLEVCGRTTPAMAELGMLYLETLGNIVFFQCALLDYRHKDAGFLPPRAVMMEAKDFTVVATVNRVAVTLDNTQRPDFWELEQQMLAVANPFVEEST